MIRENKKSFPESPFGKGGKFCEAKIGGFSAGISKSPLTPLYERGEFLDPSFRWDDNGYNLAKLSPNLKIIPP